MGELIIGLLEFIKAVVYMLWEVFRTRSSLLINQALKLPYKFFIAGSIVITILLIIADRINKKK